MATGSMKASDAASSGMNTNDSPATTNTASTRGSAGLTGPISPSSPLTMSCAPSREVALGGKTALVSGDERRPRRGEGVCAGAAVGTAEACGGGRRAATAPRA
ncbi:hypothetical protein GCM10009799_23080 [Nocardiopsis rhodophaea]|uniref:Uncharacterized protein n=1 Tax=Nocardiopsis rhodophaea TaxID=280238 RepID=A0ABN2T0X8_9ACTN